MHEKNKSTLIIGIPEAIQTNFTTIPSEYDIAIDLSNSHRIKYQAKDFHNSILNTKKEVLSLFTFNEIHLIERILESNLKIALKSNLEENNHRVSLFSSLMYSQKWPLLIITNEFKVRLIINKKLFWRNEILKLYKDLKISNECTPKIWISSKDSKSMDNGYDIYIIW